MNTINKLEQTESNIAVKKTDYVGKDGLLYCGNCNTKKQIRIYFLGKEEIEVLEHAPMADWAYDAEKHWHECECGEDLEVAPHAFNEGVVTTEPSVGVPGVKTYTCECGYSYEEALKALPEEPSEGGEEPGEPEQPGETDKPEQPGETDKPEQPGETDKPAYSACLISAFVARRSSWT